MLIRRLAMAPLVLLVLATVSFFLIHAVKGGPFDGERRMDAETAAALNARYHLDRPLLVQYGLWLRDVASGDLGESFKHKGVSVNEIVASKLPVSAWLGGLALVLALCLGLGVGILGAIRAGTVVDHGTTLAAAVLVTIPAFVIAPVLIALFASGFGWLPVAGWAGYGAVGHLVLPALTLALPFAARIARLVRGELGDALRLDHVRTATAKGAARSVVVGRHALPIAMVPVAAFLGPATAYLLTGSLVVEKIFQIPGLGREFVESALNRDYTLVLGTVLVYGAIVVVANVLSDLLVAWLDPRVRKSS
jgi:oligopeptide transport system permease protein